MMKNIALVLAAVALVACAEEVETLDDLPVAADPTPALERVAEPDECGIVPDTELCALACDRQAFIETYVQPGTCVAYECTLADGSPIRVGGCRL